MDISFRQLQRDGGLIDVYMFAALVYFIMSHAASLLLGYLRQRTSIVR